ncbi:MAG: preprotein translocase subunit SecA, partial [Candidatus Firestonebacteria bacterium]
LNALTGEGVHIVTVNDYLAERDSLGKGNFKGMGNIYNYLGFSVGCIRNDSSSEERQKAYACDITYGTNNEFGFDYLRDNMATNLKDVVQRKHNYAIVDEVDSILIDEARTPLIISGAADESTDKYYRLNKLAPYFKRDEDFKVEEQHKTLSITEAGVAKAEKLLEMPNLFDGLHMDYVHHLINALKAHTFYKKDVDYIVKDGEILIVDEFTGRLMPGRRWSDGMHQAIEAKEGVDIRRENQTLATITLQNYFRMYKKLAGMTGTAETEAEELSHTYKLGVSMIPTNKPMIRNDFDDEIYKTRKEKIKAIVEDVKKLNEEGRPVLIGTISIERNEELSLALNRRGVPHKVLNAKFHEQEAEIISMAGQRGAVTVATNMAGRGTDIVLGEGVAALGGLHITGTERHESRRIDNQLRGRCARQGDQGSSKFFLSLEDDLMRVFGSERMIKIMDTFKIEEDTPITHPWINKTIEGAQKRVEGMNFEYRKHTVEYDNVMNKQREIVYTQRRDILKKNDVKEQVLKWLNDELNNLMETYAPEKQASLEWDISGMKTKVLDLFNFNYEIGQKELRLLSQEQLREELEKQVLALYSAREAANGSEVTRFFERMIMLQSIDNKWKDHLYNMDHLRSGIGLRGYAGKDPLIEYQKEGFQMFSEMIGNIKEEVLKFLFRVQVKVEDRQALEEHVEARKPAQKVSYEHKEMNAFGARQPQAQAREAHSIGGAPRP